MREKLEEVYARLYAHLGPQHWWPGETRWEIMVGAVLTQNTSWRNVEKAMANLKKARRLDPAAMHRAHPSTLARLIRPSGYFNLKARKLRALVGFLFDRYAGDPARMVGGDPAAQRAELLEVYGIGPETADSILLYAAEQPVFVVDAYTQRIFARLGLVAEGVSYDALQQLFMEHLEPSAAYFNEYHALLVALGKNICTKRAPRCSLCPLEDICARAGLAALQKAGRWTDDVGANVGAGTPGIAPGIKVGATRFVQIDIVSYNYKPRGLIRAFFL